MLNGSIHDLARACTELMPQPRRCGWDAYGTEEPCGEPAHQYFGWKLGEYDPETREHEHRIRWLCLKHYAQEDAEDELAGGLCHDFLEWKDLLFATEQVETKEAVVQLIEDTMRRTEALYAARVEYAERVSKLEGPGTVAEVDEIYRDTVEAARSAPLDRRLPDKAGAALELEAEKHYED